MSVSEEWEEFSAYRPMIEDAIRRGREEREREILEALSSDCHYSTYPHPCECNALTPDQVDYIENLIKEDQ